MSSPAPASNPPPLDRVGAAAARLVLALYPRRFRRRFAAPALDAARRRATDLRRARGTIGTARYWVGQWLDLARNVPGEWLDRGRLPATLTFRSSPESSAMDTLRSDLRFAFRTLRKRPGFAAVVVATLALGIGASTAIFSIIDAVVLRPMPYERPEELVLILDDIRGLNLARAARRVRGAGGPRSDDPIRGHRGPDPTVRGAARDRRR